SYTELEQAPVCVGIV
ncbi:peptidase C39, bacteriocin processing domain protein, partial [Vibrio harveyi]